MIFTVRSWPGGKPAVCNHFPRQPHGGVNLFRPSVTALLNFQCARAVWCYPLPVSYPAVFFTNAERKARAPGHILFPEEAETVTMN